MKNLKTLTILGLIIAIGPVFAVVTVKVPPDTFGVRGQLVALTCTVRTSVSDTILATVWDKFGWVYRGTGRVFIESLRVADIDVSIPFYAPQPCTNYVWLTARRLSDTTDFDSDTCRVICIHPQFDYGFDRVSGGVEWISDAPNFSFKSHAINYGQKDTTTTISLHVYRYEGEEADTWYSESRVIRAAPGNTASTTFSFFVPLTKRGSEFSLSVAPDENPFNNSTGLDNIGYPNGWHKMRDLYGTTKNKRVKAGGALTILGDKIYALIGSTSDLMSYDLNTNTWTKKSDVPGNKRVKKGAAITTDGRYIYVFKGGNTQEFYRYNPATNSWKRLPEPGFGKGIKGGSMAYDGDSFIYAICGSNNDEWKKFNIYTETWHAATPTALPAPKWKTGSWICYANGKIYGLRVGGKTNEFYKWTAGTWTRTTDMPLIGSGGKKKKAKEGSAGAYDGDNFIYALKGGNTKEFYGFDLAREEWLPRESIIQILYYSGQTIVPAKKVRGGGALTAFLFPDTLRGDTLRAFFAFIGNNTNEFWLYLPQIYTFSGSQSPSPSKSSELTISVYPNPCRQGVPLQISISQSTSTSVSLYDISGRALARFKISDSRFQIPTSNLQPGIYFLRFSGSLENRKIVIK